MEVKKRVAEHLAAQTLGTVEDIVEYLFKSNIIDFRRCEIAFVKEYYFDLIRQNPELRHREAKELTAKKFCISESKVENFIYHFKNVNF